MEQATAVSATFVDVNFSNVLARSCNFDDASLNTEEQNWFSMQKADFSKATFNGANISFADVTRACFFGTDFSKCNELLMGVTTFKEMDRPSLYPSVFIGPEIAFNPYFNSETRWPRHLKFPKAPIPWSHIGKFAGIFVFGFCAAVTLSNTWLGLTFGASSAAIIFAILLSVGLPFGWFWKRRKDINAEIERDPSLHYGKHNPSRNEYRLGERCSEELG